MSKRTVVPPVATQPIVNTRFTMEEAFRNWTLLVTSLGVPVIGEGSPEGVVDAPQFALYLDSLAIVPPMQYRKMITQIGGNTKLGWLPV